MDSTTALVPGSLGAIAKQTGASLAETFLNASCIVICDTSGSMAARDSRGGKSRYDVELEELAKLQAAMPGKIAVIAFSHSVTFCPDGRPYNFGGNTDLASALDFAKVADVPGIRFVIISDGIPDEPELALCAARKYKARIDAIYVGPEADNDGGRRFLERLALESGGKAMAANRAMELAAKAQLLLAA